MSIIRDKSKFLVLPWKPTKSMFTYWQGYLWDTLLIVAVTAIGFYFKNIFSLENILTFYLLIIVISSIYWGLGPSIYSSVLIIVAIDYFLITPILGFIPVRVQDIATLIVLLIISTLISYLASRFRQRTEEAQRREYEANTLYELNKYLAKSTELNSGIKIIIQMGKDIFGYDMAIFLADLQNNKLMAPYAANPNFTYDTQEMAFADWVFQKGRELEGRVSQFPTAKARYLPLITSRGTVGVLSLWKPDDNIFSLTEEQTRLLQTFTGLTAISIENIKLAEEAQKAETLKIREKLQTAVLNSISHDLRTPLVSVIGVLSSLQEEGMDLDERARNNLIQVAREDAERLNRLIANLLDISRIEAGAVKILKQPADISDLIGVALNQLGNQAVKRSIEIDLPAELPFVYVDFNLIVQALFNILDNALKYSPEDSSIEISARQIGREIELEIADHGIGIPPQDLLFVFEKFYRVQHKTHLPGLGLGLSICKGIIEAHDGTIVAENRPGGGTIIKLKLPLVEPDTGNGNQKE